MKYLYAYRNIALPANFVTLICCIEVWLDPSLTALSLLFWIKVIITFVLILFIHLFRPDLVFFFMNIGFGRMRFYSVMLITDVIVFITAMTLTILTS